MYHPMLARIVPLCVLPRPSSVRYVMLMSPCICWRPVPKVQLLTVNVCDAPFWRGDANEAVHKPREIFVTVTSRPSVLVRCIAGSVEEKVASSHEIPGDSKQSVGVVLCGRKTP